MNTALLQLGIFGVLAATCLVGYVIESNRTRAWNTVKTGAQGLVRTFRASGQGEWLMLGISEEASFDQVSASPELVSSGFELHDDAGGAWLVPQGTRIAIRAIEGARRAPLDAITTEAGVRPRFTFEVAPGTQLFARAPQAGSDAGEAVEGAYRSGRVLTGAGTPLVLAGKAAAVSGQAFPGCWMMILFPFVVGGGIGAAAGSEPIGWIGIGIATVLAVIGFTALPERPETSA